MRRVLALALVWSSFVSLSAAQNVSQAREFFEQGVEALDDGRFRDAAELLERSLAIRESAAARFNRALALRGAGRYTEALEDITRTLELANQRRHRQLRVQAEAMRAEIAAQLVQVRIHVEGSAESVEIDGEVVARRDGLLELQRNPGPIVLVVRREGYAPVERDYELVAGSERDLHLDAAERPLPARVVLVANPSFAELRWDGRNVGEGRAQFEVPIPGGQGEFHVEVTAEGYHPEEREVELAPGEEARLDFSLSEIAVTPIQRKWWFWTLLIVGVGAVATGVGLGVRPDEQPIELGDLGFSQQVLRRR